ncbi:hypothetical protein EV361DRAFT_926164 [Lentinula raphanica]|nr:hypothetical protein F5880DRAFT_337918 [Lentinula raphanica]KAJ3968389.1 hypothetical protein EV361DRAFT_926164 [Lentinula raphanica]
MRLNTSSVLCTLLCLGPIIHTACGRPAPPSGSSKLTQSSGSGTSATPQTLTVSIDFPPPNDAKHPESASVPHEAVEVNKDLPYNYAVSGLEYYETSAHLRSYFGPKYAQHKIDYVMGKRWTERIMSYPSARSSSGMDSWICDTGSRSLSRLAILAILTPSSNNLEVKLNSISGLILKT